MPSFRLLQTLALVLILPAAWAVAQEEAAEPAATEPAAQSEAKPSATKAEKPEVAKKESKAEEANPEKSKSGKPKSEDPKSENIKSEISNLKSEEKKAEDKKADEKKSADEKKKADEKKADSTPAAEPKDEAAEPAEPKKLVGLGKVEGPPLPDQPWRVHDLFRPQPPIVTPADVDITVPPPSDAVVLFGGDSLALWGHLDRDEAGTFLEPQWKVADGYFETQPGSGDLYTLDSFGSVQLHLEWAAPAEPRGKAQGRGNSGVKFLGLYEVQILDSFQNRTYADGHAGSIYGQYPPAVNATRPPGKWQSYDIIFEIPEFDGEQLVRPGYLTVLHNGVLVQHRRELAGVTGMKSPGEYSPHPPAGPIMLQDHGNPVRFRNVWVRRLD